jgi:putative ABC transport system permease protein
MTLRLDDDADSGAVLRTLRQRRPDLTWAKTGAGMVDYLVRDTTRDFRLFQLLLILILALAGVGLVNAMTIAALGRVREIGVLRALGTSRRQLRQALLVEGLLTGGLAALIAVPLGVPFGRLIVHGMNTVAGVSAPYAPPWHAILAAPIAALAVGALAAWMPGARIVRIEPAAAVRFE